MCNKLNMYQHVNKFNIGTQVTHTRINAPKISLTFANLENILWFTKLLGICFLITLKIGWFECTCHPINSRQKINSILGDMSKMCLLQPTEQAKDTSHWILIYYSIFKLNIFHWILLQSNKQLNWKYCNTYKKYHLLVFQ